MFSSARLMGTKVSWALQFVWICFWSGFGFEFGFEFGFVEKFTKIIPIPAQKTRSKLPRTCPVFCEFVCALYLCRKSFFFEIVAARIYVYIYMLYVVWHGQACHDEWGRLAFGIYPLFALLRKCNPLLDMSISSLMHRTKRQQHQQGSWGQMSGKGGIAWLKSQRFSSNLQKWNTHTPRGPQSSMWHVSVHSKSKQHAQGEIGIIILLTY